MSPAAPLPVLRRFARRLPRFIVHCQVPGFGRIAHSIVALDFAEAEARARRAYSRKTIHVLEVRRMTGAPALKVVTS
ncbi:hypothetical protein [Rhodovulum marinum]|uniref:Uncharacterized protein n=1 Tax=Rhodovulum marinum TaxID=320662 RepID=A0A4R2Q5Q7_9RHOB|nr:hypothetical protein [Rhodovulum marinum]TCP43967.1 hypothetical protein EV662_10152 [Rhodovulum marinum]